jgi:hypothetical protein
MHQGIPLDRLSFQLLLLPRAVAYALSRRGLHTVSEPVDYTN